MSCSEYCRVFCLVCNQYMSPIYKKKYGDAVRRENVRKNISAICLVQLHGKISWSFQNFQVCLQKWPFWIGCPPLQTAAHVQGFVPSSHLALAPQGCWSQQQLHGTGRDTLSSWGQPIAMISFPDLSTKQNVITEIH